MEPRPYVLKEINWKYVKENRYDLAILPWGATEAHNYQLPFGTDVIECDYIAEESAGIAWNNGVKVIVLPTIPFGVNTQQLDIPLTINMNPSTQAFVLRDVVDSLNGQGIKKLIVLNGHGGNDFKQMIREISSDYTDFFLGQVNWYVVEKNWSDFFEDVGDHAGEMETSIMLNIIPDWVLPKDQWGDGASKKLKFKAREEGWLWAPREWTKVSNDTGIGNPEKATVEKGEKFLYSILLKLANLYKEITETRIDDIYE